MNGEFTSLRVVLVWRPIARTKPFQAIRKCIAVVRPRNALFSAVTYICSCLG